MKEKKIFIQMEVTIDLDNEDLEDFLLYLPEEFSSFVIRQDVIIEDELHGKDIKILNEKGKIISADDIVNGTEEVKEVEEEDEGKTKDIRTIKVKLKNGNDPLHGSHCGLRKSNGMVELSEVLPKEEYIPNSYERKRTYLIPLENISFVEVIKPIK